MIVQPLIIHFFNLLHIVREHRINVWHNVNQNAFFGSPEQRVWVITVHLDKESRVIGKPNESRLQ